MKKFFYSFVVLLFTVPLCAAPEWQLTFSDDFDGSKGSLPDSKKWTYNLGTGDNGWGNAQLEYDTDHNAKMDGKGNLIIESRKENYQGSAYTSSRMLTKGLFSQAYGRFEARMKVPYGQGIWPAFWMLSDSIKTVGWPACGEIDIMEYIGSEGNKVHGTVHGPGYSASKGVGGAGTIEEGNIEDTFRLYAVEWDLNEIRWYLDDKQYFKASFKDVGGAPWVFDTPFFMILGTAVGGYWPGAPDATTVFPQKLVVDYVRVYKDKNFKIPANYKRPGKAFPTPVPARKYGGTHSISLPGHLEAEDFVDYKDFDKSNQGNWYRDTGVDLGDAQDDAGNIKVGWTKPGEWLAYDVDVAKTGKYTVLARVGCDGVGGKFHFEINGKRVSSVMQVPSTGGWGQWTTIKGKISLPVGHYRLKVLLEKGAGGDSIVGDFNWFEIKH